MYYDNEENSRDFPETDQKTSQELVTSTFQYDDSRRREIELMAQTNPLIKGLISGVITYYIETIPAYVNQDVRNSINEYDRGIDGVYDEGLRITFQ